MNIDIKTFVEKFASQFEESQLELFSPTTIFRELDEWDSMIALMIIAMVDEEYKVKLSGDEIKGSVTIQDIFDKVIAKANG
jgi:acyl carrier protein